MANIDYCIFHHMRGFLPVKYFRNWARFVAAMNIVLSDSILTESLNSQKLGPVYSNSTFPFED